MLANGARHPAAGDALRLTAVVDRAMARTVWRVLVVGCAAARTPGRVDGPAEVRAWSEAEPLRQGAHSRRRSPLGSHPRVCPWHAGCGSRLHRSLVPHRRPQPAGRLGCGRLSRHLPRALPSDHRGVDTASRRDEFGYWGDKRDSVLVDHSLLPPPVFPVPTPGVPVSPASPELLGPERVRRTAVLIPRTAAKMNSANPMRLAVVRSVPSQSRKAACRVALFKNGHLSNGPPGSRSRHLGIKSPGQDVAV